MNDSPDTVYGSADTDGAVASSDGNKRMLLVCRTAPYGNSLARESIEAALAAGALGVKVSILFLDEGVWQLVEHQKPENIASKNHGAILSALPLYDIEQTWVDGDALNQRGIDGENLIDLAQVINSNQVKDVLADYEVILSF